jgi:hypothetical protein
MSLQSKAEAWSQGELLSLHATYCTNLCQPGAVEALTRRVGMLAQVVFSDIGLKIDSVP